jgi:hypothetical protein
MAMTAAAAACPASAGAFAKEAPQVQTPQGSSFHNFTFNAQGKFRIMQITDTHYIAGDARSKRAMDNLIQMLDTEKPDLVIHTGDIIFAKPAERSFDELFAPIIERKIPFAVALGLDGAPTVPGHDPAARAVVVATRERGFVKTNKTEQMYLRSRRYDGYEYYTDALASRAERYNASREQLFELEAAGRVLVIEPPRPVEVGNTGAEGGKLLELYLQGRTAAEQKLDQLRELAG